MPQTTSRSPCFDVDGVGRHVGVRQLGDARGDRDERAQRHPVRGGELGRERERRPLVERRDEHGDAHAADPPAPPDVRPERPRAPGRARAGRYRAPRAPPLGLSRAATRRAGSQRPPGSPTCPDHGSPGCSARRASSTSSVVQADEHGRLDGGTLELGRGHRRERVGEHPEQRERQRPHAGQHQALAPCRAPVLALVLGCGQLTLAASADWPDRGDGTPKAPANRLPRGLSDPDAAASAEAGRRCAPRVPLPPARRPEPASAADPPDQVDREIRSSQRRGCGQMTLAASANWPGYAETGRRKRPRTGARAAFPIRTRQPARRRADAARRECHFHRRAARNPAYGRRSA